MKKIHNELMILKLKCMSWLARRSRCLSVRWGLVGILGAEITSGPNKGMQLGIVIAISQIRESGL